MSTAENSRSKILHAATAEFAEHGIAGARVDRIVQNSGMSKPMLYAYFGGKEALFDVVFNSHVIDNSERVPFTPDDLPGYAAKLYDYYLTDPFLMRLVMWKRLERETSGYLYAGLEDSDASHLAAIADRQSTGGLRNDIGPSDLWSLVISSAATWAQGSITAVATTEDAAELHSRRRSALVAFLQGALAGSGA